jgi:amidohydrolase
MSDIHERILAVIDGLSGELLEFSHAIHAHPEVAFQERFACELLRDTLVRHGLPVSTGVYTLETSLESAFSGVPGATVALLAEYDALPSVGHACGHNIIATASLGAMLALHAVAERLPGTVKLIGTPAEETGGGKELMARAGAFAGIDAALMIHPAAVNLPAMPVICVAEVVVIYHGRAAHASAQPHQGINALDALVLAYQAIGNLRQHIRASERIHGIITEGGQAPNVVPERAAGYFFVRAADAQALETLKARVLGCFEAGARATGCELEVRWDPTDYLDLNSNGPLEECFQRHAEALGRRFGKPEDFGGAGSTDMGNVSHRVAAIHPLLACAPAGIPLHHPDFAQWAASDLGDRAALDGAKALALTAADFLLEPELQRRTREAFERSQTRETARAP